MTTLPPSPSGSGMDPLLSQRALLVLLTAAFLGTVIGVLTFFSEGSVAGAVVTGLFAAAGSTLGLHALIGR
jgi:hypothetical protein